MVRDKKGGSDDDFLKSLGTVPQQGMVMTHPPVGESKSREEMLRDAMGGAADIIWTGKSDLSSVIQTSLIVNSPFQVRGVDDQFIDELAQSIADTGGVISPIVVRKLEAGKYEVIAGHTRLLAVVRLGHETIPAIIRSMSDEAAAKALAADNLARKDLTDFETFKQLTLLQEKGFVKSNSEMSRLIGRARQDVIRYMAYAKLPSEVIELLERDPAFIGASYAKSLSDFTDRGLAHHVIEGCKRLFDGLIKNQVALINWINQQDTKKPVRNEFRVLDDQGKLIAKVSVSESGIKIGGKGLDLQAVQELLRRELPSCKK